MGIKEAISNYKPYNEQEEQDKAIMLNDIDSYDDILSRENENTHFVSSAWVMNKARDKVLMVYHKIYDSWMWTGGHADGNEDLLSVAIKETKEETGIKNIRPITNDIYMLDIFPVLEHERKGKIVPAHRHLNTTYLLEADEREELTHQEEENSAVAWIPINEIVKYARKEGMRKMGLKLMERLEKEKNEQELSISKKGL